MIVSANSASCTPAEPTVAGPSALKKRFTSSSSLGRRSAVITSARSAAPPTSSTSSTPAISTPHAAACPAVGKKAASSSANIMVRLSRIGAAAAVANLPIELRMPENSVTSVISAR